MQYRKDIDGLRAVAVLPIVMFHAGISRLAGGFVGVDIFFVISGFLITSIVSVEISQGRFSIATFYRRRITRIFPALFAMLLVVLIVGCATMLPLEVAALGRSAGAAAGFVSNIFFWFETDYFDAAAETKPLLHTWSLAVEEQFYILYPLLLILVARLWPDRLRLALWIVILSSLLAAAVVGFQSPTASFYLLPARAWELAIGGLVAAGGFPKIARANLRNGASFIGLGLIAAAVVLVRSDMPFPFPWALLPCLGAALLVAYGQDGFVARLLSTAPLRAIGHISYSLYLWHWPIITFYRQDTGQGLSLAESTGLITVSILCGALSYFLIEQPVQRRFRHGATRPILIVGGSGLAAMLAVGAMVTTNAAHWRDWTPREMRIASYANYRDRPEYEYQFRRGECFRGEGEPFRPHHCLKIAANRPNVVVLGDSHAAQYWRAIALRFPGVNIMQATASGCRPLLHGKGAARCREVVDYVLGPMLATRGVDAVILAGRWQSDDLPRLLRTIVHIRAANARPILIGPTIEYDGAFPTLLARGMADRDMTEVTSAIGRDRMQLDSDMARAVRSSGARYISAIGIECPGGKCLKTAPDGGPMQFDYGHLTFAAARWVVQRMDFGLLNGAASTGVIIN
ncbi:Acyltransferase 3 [Sphingomonas paucimobilis]|nr:Acyltransferase 3 [Sphingomonas paucimobilis]